MSSDAFEEGHEHRCACGATWGGGPSQDVPVDAVLGLVRMLAASEAQVAAALRILSDRAEYWWVDDLLPELGG